MASGNITKARKASEKAKGLNIVALMFGLCIIIGLLIYQFAV